MSGMLIDDIVFLLENRGDFSVPAVCLDCGKEFKIEIKRTEDAKISISGGAIYKPDTHMGYDVKYVFKCDDCHKIDSKIYARTLTFSRCVGYITPTKQYNNGKLAEFHTRKMFDIDTMPSA